MSNAAAVALVEATAASVGAMIGTTILCVPKTPINHSSSIR